MKIPKLFKIIHATKRLNTSRFTIMPHHANSILVVSESSFKPNLKKRGTRGVVDD
jgi:hypothetical protein